MPYSGKEFEGALQKLIENLKPGRILDVGVGAGKIARIAKSAHPGTKVLGIEAHGPYATQFVEQWKLYDHVWIGDARDVSLKIASERFSLVVFGDALEHMWKTDALNLIEFWLPRCAYQVLIWPIGYAQDATGGVTSEIHRCELRLPDLAHLPVARFHHYLRVGVGQAKCMAVLRGKGATKDTQAGVVYG